MKKIITLLLTMTASMVFAATAMAADETINGFYDIGTATDVVITPFAGDTQVAATEKNIDDDEAMEAVYVNSNKLGVTYSDATANEHYSIILVDGTGLPTKDTEIYYINQETATSSDVSFNAGIKKPTETTDMTLYISSSAKDFDLVSVLMNYAVNATEAATYKAGDANGDGIIDVKDVITIRRHIAGGYTITIIEEAANVNGDAIIDVKDAITIRRFIAGGYGVEL